MAKKKYYAVLNGKIPGIYMDWDSCKKNVDGFKGAIYKSFPTIEEAKAFMEGESTSSSANASKIHLLLYFIRIFFSKIFQAATICLLY